MLGSAAAVGSMPSSATFFITYESLKRVSALSGAKGHMLASSVGECLSCLIRVPTEVVKQKVQARQATSSWQCLRSILAKQGVRGLFVGYWTTVMRDVPFSAIQYPIWEALRTQYNPEGSGFKSGVCGSCAGAIAGTLTTPIDVVKTRLMTATERVTVLETVRVLAAEGPRSFFNGLSARLGWLTVGGFVYLGTYQYVLDALSL